MQKALRFAKLTAQEHFNTRTSWLLDPVREIFTFIWNEHDTG